MRPRTAPLPAPALGVLVVLVAPVALAALLVAALPRTAGAAPPGEGERVQVSGIVTDSQGKPLPDLRVVLEASRRSFSLREMRRADRDVRRVSAVTNARGEYALEWPFDSYFNNFELQVALAVKKGEGDRLDVLQRQDVTQRILKGGPVVVAMTVERPGRIDAMRQFVAGVDTEDERRVYGELGNPDEVKSVRYPDHEEVSWWYFESGRMYRFRNGALEQVVHFDPVKSF